MFKNVVVGIDERDSWHDAAALATQLTTRDGRLTLVNVYVFRADSRLSRGYSREYETADRERAAQLLETARGEVGVDAEIHWRGAASVGRGLHEVVDLLGADLLVVGSSRQGLFGRVMLHDDTRASLNGAPCAIGVAPAGYVRQTPAIERVGVGYDGSPESEVALSLARELAADLNAGLSGLEVVSTPAEMFIDPEGVSLQHAVSEARERVAALGGIEPFAAYGDPAEELTLYSDAVDLLVVGSRGYGPLGRVIHGSTSQKLARTARCPIVVLTRGARGTANPESEAVQPAAASHS